MKRRIFLGILSAAMLISGSIVLPDTADAQLFNRDQLRCRSRIAAATRRYYERQSRARRACVKRIITGKIPPSTDCIKSDGDEILQRQLPQIRAIVGRIIPRSCAGVNLIFLGFPGICEDVTGIPFDTRDLESCILSETDEIVMDLLMNSYPEIDSFLRGAPGTCVRGVADRTAGAVTQNLRARLKCLLRQERRVTSADVDCRGDIPPYGDGTTDSGTDQQIEASYIRVLSGIPAVCGGADLIDLGLNDMCDDATGEDFNLFDLKQCLLDDVRIKIPDLLDIPFPREPVCGDAIVGGEEECDDGQNVNSDTQPDACRVDCTLPTCGDGVTDPSNSEACDDGNLDDGDGCDSVCVIEICGDGVINNSGTEACDNGEDNSDVTPDACRTDCTEPICGDDVQDTGESCDDGNNQSEDGCNADCSAVEFCGDGIRQVGLSEQCDDGSANSDEDPDACRSDCTVPTCGDGVTDPSNSEECDDGNDDDGDGCSNQCTICGNGVISGDEECDDGIDNSDLTPDACRENCTEPVCGDGVIDPSNSEVCDDNNTNPNDLCTDVCQIARCGDGAVCTDPILCATGPGNGIEQCDDGDGANSDTEPNACRTDCSTPVCGDGVTDSGESCDGESRDGCASNEACLDSCECKHLCPGSGELTLFAGAGPECSSNGDCIVGTCDGSIGRCRTVTQLDSGWNGIAHDADINNLTITRGFLECPATGPVCGECNVVGVDPSAGNCRCSADNRSFCDQTFSTDSACDFGGCVSKVCNRDPDMRSCTEDADCIDEELGNLGQCVGQCSGNDDVACRNDEICQEANCLCYFGSPFPLSSGGTPACVVNRFSEDIVGTGNVDTGAGEITAKLRTQVFLGDTNTQPCTFCGGRCESNQEILCQFDDECGGDGPCVLDEIANDGVRGGFCIDGEDAGKSCDVAAFNTSFPARPMAEGGGGYSLDCFPVVGKNVSGEGLRIEITQTTGVTTLSADLTCGNNPAFKCPCKMCSSDTSVPCTSDSDCSDQEGSCSIVASQTCTGDADCESVSAGNCISLNPQMTIFRCANAFSISCDSNADCAAVDGGSCNLPTCNSVGSGISVQPNQCSDGQCNDVGGGEGACNTGPTDRFCDGVTRANGDGILGCGSNADCDASVIGIDAGACTLERRRECFMDPIVASGVASPSQPIGAANFCIPPTSSAGINGAAGLPGPGRVTNQATSLTFCAEDPDFVYTPGVGGCPQ